MSKIVLLVLLVFALCNCKDKKDPKPLPEIAGIVGKWRLAERMYTVNDSTIIETVSKENGYVIAFRFDGMLLNEAGQGACCGPSSYLLNGILFEIKPIGELPPYDPKCSFVDCMACPEWKLTQQGANLVIESCNGGKLSYIREK